MSKIPMFPNKFAIFASILGAADIIYGDISSGESFQLLSVSNTIAIVIAYDIDDSQKYCGAVVMVGSNSSSNILQIIAKFENGMTIDGEWWGSVKFKTESGHRIHYKGRYLLTIQ